MADILEAFNTLKFQKKAFQSIDYFFTQRNMMEEREHIDKNMNRVIKKVKITHNFLALNIPTIFTTSTNGQPSEKPMGFDIEIYGDDGYQYIGTITSYQGIMPNFMIPIKGDKKLFVNITYKFTDANDNGGTRRFVNFIEVPKRFQQLDDIENLDSTSQTTKNDNQDNEVEL